MALFYAYGATGSATTQSVISTVRNGRSAVIVGGGPVGLAASLMLEKCGWDDITIIEKRPINFFESSKAYLYLIDGRGQKCTNLLGMKTLLKYKNLLFSLNNFKHP
jgi:hypothetical protein